MVQARFFAAIPYHVPHHVLGDTLAPHLASLADGTKYPPVRDLRCGGPQIERLFGPLRNRHGANVPPLPIRSTIAQWLWRVWTSSVSRLASSDRRNPQPNSMAMPAASSGLSSPASAASYASRRT